MIAGNTSKDTVRSSPDLYPDQRSTRATKNNKPNKKLRFKNRPPHHQNILKAILNRGTIPLFLLSHQLFICPEDIGFLLHISKE
jgi:hypothetical protein